MKQVGAPVSQYTGGRDSQAMTWARRTRPHQPQVAGLSYGVKWPERRRQLREAPFRAQQPPRLGSPGHITCPTASPEAATMGPKALARAPRLRSVPMTVPFCPGEPVGEKEGPSGACWLLPTPEALVGKGLSP